MVDREPEGPEERRIRFRIGIDIGNVIAEEDYIFGDGVNIAARLEGLAEPGALCVSRAVGDQVRINSTAHSRTWGEQQVKNIARPVRVYGLPDLSTVANSVAAPVLTLPDKPSIAVLP